MDFKTSASLAARMILVVQYVELNQKYFIKRFRCCSRSHAESLVQELFVPNKVLRRPMVNPIYIPKFHTVFEGRGSSHSRSKCQLIQLDEATTWRPSPKRVSPALKGRLHIEKVEQNGTYRENRASWSTKSKNTPILTKAKRWAQRTE